MLYLCGVFKSNIEMKTYVIKKKKGLLVVALALFTCTLSAQDHVTAPELEVTTVADSMSKRILEELMSIKAFQETSRAERQEAWRRHEAQKADEAKDSLSSEYSAMLKIADNTQQDPIKDDWNLYGWVAFAIALVSLFVAGVTLWAQWQTERHTTNAPVEVQLWKLRDLPRHFYRNLVCTCAIIFKYRAEGSEKRRRRYPSESNLMKLQTLPDDIVLPIDVSKSRAYRYMHELKLLLRNYNVEVEVAAEHLSRKRITDASLVQDFDNLLFKPLFLTGSKFYFERSLSGETKVALEDQTIYAILAEHFRKLKEPSNFKVLYEKEEAQRCLQLLAQVEPASQRNEFVEVIDTEKSLDRSINKLISYLFKKEEVDEGGTWFWKRNDATSGMPDVVHGDGIEYRKEGNVVTIDGVRAVARLTEVLKEEDGKFGGFLSALIAIEDAKAFEAFCSTYYSEANASDTVADLYGLLEPYLRFLSRGTWDFRSLLKHILIVDAAIETSRIGMVNFE